MISSRRIQKHLKSSHWNQTNKKTERSNAKKATPKTLKDTCTAEWHRCFWKLHVLVNSHRMRVSPKITETCVWVLLIYPRPPEKRNNNTANYTQHSFRSTARKTMSSSAKNSQNLPGSNKDQPKDRQGAWRRPRRV